MNQKVKSYLLILSVTVAAFFSACKENGDLMTAGKLSNLNIINATKDTLNVYQNGARLNNLSTLGPGSVTGYTSITANSTNFEVKKAGATNYLIGNFAAQLDTNHYYSLFIAGETADKLFVSNDATPVDSANSSKVRFINASPTTVIVDVTVDKLSFTNLAFKSITPFRYNPVDTALVTVYQHGTTVKLKTGKIPLLINTAYTIYLQGVPNSSGADSLVLRANIN